MSSLPKFFCALFIVVLAASSLSIAAVFAQSVTAPSTPGFTVQLADHSYDKAPTYTTDPYTGKTVQNGGGHVENKTIDITIENQQFTNSFNGTTYELYYSVRAKGHFAQNWTTLQIGGYHTEAFDLLDICVPQSDSQHTVISIPQSYPVDSQVDFQVQALLVYNGSVFIVDHPLLVPFPNNGHYETGAVSDSASDWSDTHTLTISSASDITGNANNTQTTDSPSAPIEQQELPQLIVIIVLLVAVLIAATVLLSVKKRKPTATNQPQ